MKSCLNDDASLEKLAPEEIKTRMKKDYGVDVSYFVAWKGRALVLDLCWRFICLAACFRWCFEGKESRLLLTFVTMGSSIRIFITLVRFVLINFDCVMLLRLYLLHVLIKHLKWMIKDNSNIFSSLLVRWLLDGILSTCDYSWWHLLD